MRPSSRRPSSRRPSSRRRSSRRRSEHVAALGDHRIGPRNRAPAEGRALGSPRRHGVRPTAPHGPWSQLLHAGARGRLRVRFARDLSCCTPGGPYARSARFRAGRRASARPDPCVPGGPPCRPGAADSRSDRVVPSWCASAKNPTRTTPRTGANHRASSPARHGARTPANHRARGPPRHGARTPARHGARTPANHRARNPARHRARRPRRGPHETPARRENGTAARLDPRPRTTCDNAVDSSGARRCGAWR